MNRLITAIALVVISTAGLVNALNTNELERKILKLELEVMTINLKLSVKELSK